jgi:hypothetical protein
LATVTTSGFGGTRASAAAALSILAVALLGSATPADAASRTKIDDFASPTFVAAPDGEERRLFVTQRAGRVKLVLDGQKREDPFLDIRGRVGTAGEGGLLSMAFAPDYETSRRFYVLYTTTSDTIRVDEFKRSESSPNRAAQTSGRHVIRIEHPGSATNHYGGQLQFGPDGDLYISTGDGGSTPEKAQDKNSLLGKLLRIDPLPSGGDQYSPPQDNPFVGVRGRNEIFAYGLRNPYRFSFDRLTGDLTIGDVGQSRREEVDFRSAGAAPGPNFGWDCFEGSLTYNGGGPCLRGPSGHTEPVHELSHGNGYCSVIGGYVARHTSLGSLQGDYVYGDLCRSELRAVHLTSGGSSNDRGIGATVDTLVSFGEDGLGRLYAVSLNGPVYRISG